MLRWLLQSIFNTNYRVLRARVSNLKSSLGFLPFPKHTWNESFVLRFFQTKYHPTLSPSFHQDMGSPAHDSHTSVPEEGQRERRELSTALTQQQQEARSHAALSQHGLLWQQDKAKPVFDRNFMPPRNGSKISSTGC